MTIHLLRQNRPIYPLIPLFSHACSSPDSLHPSLCPPLVHPLNIVFYSPQMLFPWGPSTFPHPHVGTMHVRGSSTPSCIVGEAVVAPWASASPSPPPCTSHVRCTVPCLPQAGGVWVWMEPWGGTTHGFVALVLLQSLLCNTLAVPMGAGCPAMPGRGCAKHGHCHVFCREGTQLSTP